ncbi:MAG TPA: hypothetical protein VIK89_04555 [Cytophagaceae bacterium]
MLKMIRLLATQLLLLISIVAYSQREDRVLYQQRLVRSIDLRITENENLFGKENKIAEVLLNALREGEITAYTSYSLNDTLSSEELDYRLKHFYSDGSFEYYSLKDLYQMELGEDLVFDTYRSELQFKPVYITLLIPELVSDKGLIEPLATFRWEDCIKIFRKYNVLTYKPVYNGRKINLTEVFVMHAYKSHICKIGKEDEVSYFDQRYANQIDAFLAGKEEEKKIIEIVYKLYNPR